MGPIPVRRLAGALTFLAVALALPSGWEVRGPLEGLTRLVGALITSSPLVLGACVHRSLPDRHDRPDDFGGLITEGPYSVVRHPFYLTTILAWLGAAVYSLSTGILLLALTSGLLWSLAAALEERGLRRRWPCEYEEYSRRVPMLIPLPRRRGAGRNSDSRG
ncbi:MAG: isoprenylcysteine carboxylmethyltransferase family protein [Candidatus Korarchaeota archaeon]|nr:isoprenylcysteine carboxylmethyltransferase family protein [Candidatus Korarchaeota archaeon]